MDSKSKPDLELSVGLEWWEMHAAFIEGKGEGMEKMNKWECFILQTSWKVVLGHENYPDMHRVLPSCRDKITWLNVPTSLRKGIQQPCQLTGLTSSLPLYRLLCTCATEKACYRRAGSEGEHLGALPLWEIKCSKGSRQVQFISGRRSLPGFVIIILDGGEKSTSLVFRYL